MPATRLGHPVRQIRGTDGVTEEDSRYDAGALLSFFAMTMEGYAKPLVQVELRCLKGLADVFLLASL